jgi:hypothetical protein
MNNKTPFELRHESVLIAREQLMEHYHSERNRIESKYGALQSDIFGDKSQEERQKMADEIDNELKTLKFPDTKAILDEAQVINSFIEGRPRRN